MPRHWIVKKNHEFRFVIVYSVVGMTVLMSLMLFVGMQAAK
jgi:hypothetical protein